MVPYALRGWAASGLTGLTSQQGAPLWSVLQPEDRSPILHSGTARETRPHMAKLSQPWDRDRIYGLKGILDFYFWKGIPVVRKWPETDPANLTQATKSQWPIFGYINQQWGATDAPVKLALGELAAGTQRLARDYQLELYYGKSITFSNAIT